MTEPMILIVTLAIIAWRESRSPAGYAKFKLAKTTRERQRFYTNWLIESFLLFGLGSILILFLTGRMTDIGMLPAEFRNIAEWFSASEEMSQALEGVVVGLLIGGVILGIALGYILRRRSQSGTTAPLVLGDVGALYPRNAPEQIRAALLSLNAGLSEELMFRLALPLLITQVTHSAWIGLVGAVIIFGFVHFYQGWTGVMATIVLGSLLTVVYLLSGRLWLAMLVHAAIDLNGLIVMPMLFRRTTS